MPEQAEKRQEEQGRSDLVVVVEGREVVVVDVEAWRAERGGEVKVASAIFIPIIFTFSSN